MSPAPAVTVDPDVLPSATVTLTPVGLSITQPRVAMTGTARRPRIGLADWSAEFTVDTAAGSVSPFALLTEGGDALLTEAGDVIVTEDA